MSAKLLLSRTSSKDIKIRGLFVWLDGREIANLAYGDSQEFVLSPGSYKLKVTNQLYSKEEAFVLAEGQVLVFETGNSISGFWAAVIGWSGFVPYKVFLKRAADLPGTDIRLRQLI